MRKGIYDDLNRNTLSRSSRILRIDDQEIRWREASGAGRRPRRGQLAKIDAA